MMEEGIMYNQWQDPLYGNFRTRTFVDIFPDVEEFLEAYKNNGIQPVLNDDTVSTLFYLLYSRYGNSHIASSDENVFKYRVWSTIFMYGPTWQKRLEIQEKIRALTDADMASGTHAIFNHAFNPSTEPTTQTKEELDFINEQNTTRYKKGKLDAYKELWDLLSTDVTKYFLDRFADLFIKILEPEYPLWYKTDIIQGGNNNDD